MNFKLRSAHDRRNPISKPDIILTFGTLGGLGDWSVFSTLPRRFAELGHKVFLHDCGRPDPSKPLWCKFDLMPRNDEIFDLFFKGNKHIAGITDRAPNAGYINQGRFYDVANRLPIGCIEAMERTHNLPPPYSMAPDICYTPKPHPHDLSNVTLYDPSALSSTIAPEGWSRFQQKMMDRFGGDGGRIYLVTHDTSVVRTPPFMEGTATIGVNSVFEYCDMLAACRAWIGSEAGGQALAAAVRGNHDVYDLQARPEIVCLIAPNTFNSRSYTFRGVDYRASIFAAGGDYLEPTETPQGRYEFDCRVNVQNKLREWREAKAGLRVG